MALAHGGLKSLVVPDADGSDASQRAQHAADSGIQQVTADGLVDLPQIHALQVHPAYVAVLLVEFRIPRDSTVAHLLHALDDRGTEFSEFFAAEKTLDTQIAVASVGIDLSRIRLSSHLLFADDEIFDEQIIDLGP